MIGLLFLPLAVLVVPSLILRPLLPRELSTSWPIMAGVLTVAAFAYVATRTHRWTGSRTAAALVTMAAFGTTAVGLFLLLLWALSSAWE
jgi:hypothetical protein